MPAKPVASPDLAKEQQRLRAENAALKAQLRHLQCQLDKLEEEKRRLLRRQFGPASEKDLTPQMRLFNEPESLVAQDADSPAEPTISVPAHQRRKGGRKPLPDHLPPLPAMESEARAGSPR